MAEVSYPSAIPVRWLCRVRLEHAVAFVWVDETYWIDAKEAARARFGVFTPVEAWRPRVGVAP